MKFFLDNCLPPSWAPALCALVEGDYQITHLREKFEADTPDVEWLRKLGEEGDWVVISGDLRITRNKHEVETWNQARLTAFFFEKAWNSQKLWEKTWRFIRWWPRIIEQSEGVTPGAGFFIPLNYGAVGKFTQA